MRTMYDYIEEIRKCNPDIRLDIGQPDLPVDKRIIEATVRALRSGKTKYTSAYGIPALREALAEKHKVPVDQVMVTVGGKFPIYAAIELCKKTAVIHPGWPAYEENLTHLKKPYQIIHTTFEDSFTPSFEILDKSFDLILTNYPNNPTGITLPRAKVKELVDLCNDYHITLLADEIYSFLTYNDFVSFQEFECEDFIYIGSFSKSFSMTGFRIGYAISNPERIRTFQNMQVHSITCAVEFAQYAALEALTIEEEVKKSATRIYSERKSIAEKALREIGLSFVPCQGAFYEFPQVPVDAELFCRNLLKEGVSVVPGIFFGDYPDHFRLSLVSDRLGEAILKMKDVLDNTKK
jgi:aspartate aminotransferase